jgi:hypothetical protein
MNAPNLIYAGLSRRAYASARAAQPATLDAFPQAVHRLLRGRVRVLRLF